MGSPMARARERCAIWANSSVSSSSPAATASAARNSTCSLVAHGGCRVDFGGDCVLQHIPHQGADIADLFQQLFVLATVEPEDICSPIRLHIALPACSWYAGPRSVPSCWRRSAQSGRPVSASTLLISCKLTALVKMSCAPRRY